MSGFAVPLPSPSTGRGSRRWSKVTIAEKLFASMAGLPESKACVKVGPPLSCNGPSFGSTLSRSLDAKPDPPDVDPMRLNPALTIGPDKSGVDVAKAVFPARIVPLIVTVFSRKIPPPLDAPFAVMVQSVMSAVASVALNSPPPRFVTELFDNVDSSSETDVVPEEFTLAIAPPSVVASLFENVLRVIVTVLVLYSPPPCAPAPLLFTVVVVTLRRPPPEFTIAPPFATEELFDSSLPVIVAVLLV